jgi:hypothetical protein
MVIPLTKDGSLGIVQPKPESLQTREIKKKKKNCVDSSTSLCQLKTSSIFH